jgi:hypothetical protein
MLKFDRSSLFNKIRQEELMELRQAIKTSVHQRKLKELEKLVQRYLFMIKPEARRL